MLENRKRFIVNVMFWAAIVAIVYVVFKYLLPFLMPFLIAALIAIFTRPLARLLARKLHIKVNITALICTFICFVIVIAIAALIGVQIVDWCIDLFSSLPAMYMETVAPAISGFSDRLTAQLGRFDPEIVDLVNSITPGVIQSVGNAATSLSNQAVNGLKDLVTSLPNFLLSCVICVIASIFITIDYEKIKSSWSVFLPARIVKVMLRSSAKLRSTIWKYVKAYGLIMIITFCEISLGLLIIGVSSAPLIALLIAVFDIFPIVGSGLVLLPWTVITFIQGNIGRGVGLAIVYVVVICVRQIMEPKIVGKHVGIHPLLTLICMFVGAHLFGGIGLFGVPITVAVAKGLDDEGVVNIFHRERNMVGCEEPMDEPEAAEHTSDDVDTLTELSDDSEE